MKVNEKTRFPHPVLSEYTGDFLSGAFSMSFTVQETPGLDRSQVSLQYLAELSEPHLLELVEDGKASAGIFVSCLDTYFGQLVPLGLHDSSFAFDPGALVGRVTIRPVIWARSPISAFPLENCHEEFGSGALAFLPGSIMALDDEVVINVGREKLAQIETIFTIAKADDLEDGMLSVALDSDRIKVLVAKDIHDTVNNLRGNERGKSVVLNSVFLPAVIQVLDSLRDGAAAYEGRRWYRIFMAKCDHLGINIEEPELWRDAQRLLEAPFEQIHIKREVLGG